MDFVHLQQCVISPASPGESSTGQAFVAGAAGVGLAWCNLASVKIGGTLRSAAKSD